MRETAVAGPADPDLVWSRYAEIARWSSWAPPIRRVEPSAPRLAAGVTGVVYGPGGLPVRFEVTAVDAVTRCWSWVVHSGPVTMTLSHEVLTRPSGGSVATLTVEGRALVARTYPAAAQVALRRLVGAP